MTIPRIIVRDLDEHSDKKELVAIYSRFRSFKNVWVANNPPGFAYVFFDNMKDALKAVASTNGRDLCGRRVRVELTPLDEEDDRKRRMSLRGRPPSRTPSPPPHYRRKRLNHSPDSPLGFPVQRDRRFDSPSFPPPPKRRMEANRRNYDDRADVSPIRERGNRRFVSARSPPRRRERDIDYHYRHGSDSSRLGKSRLPAKGSYRDQEEKRRYNNNNDRYLSSKYSPPVSSYFSLDPYEGHHNQRFDKQIYDGYSSKYPSDASIVVDKYQESYDEFGRQSVQSWRSGKINEDYDYYAGLLSPGTPPPPPPPPPVTRHSRSINREKGTSSKNNRERSQQGHSSIGYDVNSDMVSLSPSRLSPPPPPPIPPPPPSHQRSKYNEGNSRQCRSRSQDRKKRDKTRKDKNNKSENHHRQEPGSSHKVHQNRSRSPLFDKQRNSFAITPSAPTDEYMFVKREISNSYQKSPSVTPPRLKDHQYYEEIEEGTEGFFSEVGYHSPRHLSQEYSNIQNTADVLEYVEQGPHQLYTVENNSFGYHNLQERTANYEERDVEQYLEIDEVKGQENGHYTPKQNSGSFHQEREVVFSSRKKEREVLHRKHERKVVVKRTPERNRSTTVPTVD